MGFAKADQLARAACCPLDAPGRTHHGLAAALSELTWGMGNSCAFLSDLVDRAVVLLAAAPPPTTTTTTTTATLAAMATAMTSPSAAATATTAALVSAAPATVIGVPAGASAVCAAVGRIAARHFWHLDLAGDPGNGPAAVAATHAYAAVVVFPTALFEAEQAIADAVSLRCRRPNGSPNGPWKGQSSAAAPVGSSSSLPRPPQRLSLGDELVERLAGGDGSLVRNDLAELDRSIGRRKAELAAMAVGRKEGGGGASEGGNGDIGDDVGGDIGGDIGGSRGGLGAGGMARRRALEAAVADLERRAAAHRRAITDQVTPSAALHRGRGASSRGGREDDRVYPWEADYPSGWMDAGPSDGSGGGGGGGGVESRSGADGSVVDGAVGRSDLADALHALGLGEKVRWGL
jgi:hypothetical protein